jgi:hypothetical protein
VSPALWLVGCICWISGKLSLGYWISHRERDSKFYGYYALGWLAVLLVILCFAPTSGNLGLAFGWLALYRLQDLLFGTIGDALQFQSFNGDWRSKVVLAIINIVQIVTIFAIAFLVFTTTSAFSPLAPPGRFGHFYLSWNTLPPLGSGFAAQTVRARVLVMIESAAGVLLTVIALSRFLGNSDKSSHASPSRPTANTPKGAA